MLRTNPILAITLTQIQCLPWPYR